MMNKMEKLKVVKNKIVNEKGKEVILKGININSPCILKYEENHDFLNDIKEIKKLGANAVRIPICPAYWQFNKNYCEEILDSIVKLTKELELYCLLDWHAHGNPFLNETREPTLFIKGYLKYDSNKELAEKALEILAERYGKENHIIFETFCSIVDLSWNEWKPIAQNFVNIMRKYTSSIICINGTKWREDSSGTKIVGKKIEYITKDVRWYQDLKSVLDNPIIDKNIVYGIMIYFGTPKEDRSAVVKVKRKYPVIIIECGYEIDAKEEYLRGTKDTYAYPLKKLIEENNLSFFAWCYHPKRVPIILNSWNPKDLTEWGKFLKNELLKNKK